MMADQQTRTPAEEGSLQRLPIGALMESPTNPRKRFGDLGELVESVRTHGVITPLLVRPIGSNPKFVAHKGTQHVTRYEIVAGHRRFRAAREARLAELPVVVRKLDDRQTLELQIIENLQREDVHPIEEAEGYQRLIDEGYTVEELARRIGKGGKSISYVYQRLKLAVLIPKAKQAFYDGEISASHAILIAREGEANQKKALDYATNPHHPPSVREFEGWIQRMFYGLDLHGAPWKKDDAELLPKAGACSACPKRTGANPALYPELKQGKDICQDARCYEAKVVAHIRQALDADAELVPVVVGYLSGADEKALKRQFKTARVIEPVMVASRKAEGARPGIVAQRSHYGPFVGHRVWFTTKKQTAARQAASPGRKRELAAQKAATAKREREKFGRAAVVRAIVEKAPAAPGERELRLAAKLLFDGLWDDDLAARHGVNGEKQGNLSKLMAARIDAWGTDSLTRFLVDAVASEAADAYHKRDNGLDLDKIAALYGVNTKAVEAAAAAECRRLQKAAAKPQPKKKKAAGAEAQAAELVHRLHAKKPKAKAAGA